MISRAMPRITALMLVLLVVEFLDEFVFGIQEAGWPLIRDDLDLSYAQIGILLSLPRLLGSFVEPPIGILGDVWKRKWLILGGGVVFVAALALTSASQSFLYLLVAFILFNPASGAFVSLSQATLMDSEPKRHQQNMARWTLAGSLGVVLGAAALGVAVLLGVGWRVLFLSSAIAAVLVLVAARGMPLGGASGTGQSGAIAKDLKQGIIDALRALKRFPVLRWLVLLEFSDLMLDGLHGYLALYFDEVGVISYFIASGWLALTLTDSPFWVGATAGMSGVSLVMGSLFAGVVVDRVDKRKLIIAGQMAQVALSFTIAFLIFTNHIALWHVLAMAFLRGLAASVKITATRTMVLDVAGRANLLAANAAALAADEGVGILIPPLVGFVVEKADIGWIYLIMGCAGLTAALLLSLLRGVESQRRSERSSPVHDLKAGLRYVFTTPIVRSLIIMGVIGEVFGWGHYAMLPVMARDVLEVGPTGLGYLASAGSVGALAASLILSTKGDINNKGRLMVLGYTGFGGFLMLFAWSEWFIASLVIFATAHFMGAVWFTVLDTLLQTRVPDALRGRVLSVQSFGFGLTNTTGFQTGAIAALLGAPVAIAIGAGIVAAHGLRLLKGVSGKFGDQQTTTVSEK